MQKLLSTTVALMLLAGCESDGISASSADDTDDEGTQVQMLPSELACAVFASSVFSEVGDSGHGLPIRVQRCSVMFEQEPGSPPSAVIVQAQGQETVSERMVGDEVQEERIPFEATFRMHLSPDDETTYTVGTGDAPGTANVELGTEVDGELMVEIFNVGAGATLSVDLELTGVQRLNSWSSAATAGEKKEIHGTFRAKLAEEPAMLECHPENKASKTLAHQYICLGEGRRCAGSTLPCCTDECENNDGDAHDPRNPLRCGSGGTCVGKSSLPAYCPMAGTAPAGANCPNGGLYCGRDAGCCPPSMPYSCPTTRDCFERQEDARDACQGSSNSCALCHPIAPVTFDPSGGACPCGSLIATLDPACSPDPLAPSCYCAQARVNDCLADNAADCMADQADARAESRRLQQAAVDEGGSCSL